MKIYFTASFSGGRQFFKQYQNILSFLKRGNILVGGEQLLGEKEINGSQQAKIMPGKSKVKIVFEREKERIESADLLVAEVSQPSLGVGSEIAYALTIDKPVLALFYRESKNLLSPMIAGNPSDNLYLEHYDEDNLNRVIKNYLNFIKENKSHKGRLIVIEGSDGSGKATQTKLLIENLKKRKIKVRQIEFPRYYTSFHGDIVARFHRGEFGTINSVSPYLISLAYALDRLSLRDQLNEWLRKGYTVIANRYVPSSLAHQAAKIPGKEREKFVDWLDELEYRVHKMPREDLVVYLSVPWQIGQKLSQQTNKKYLNGKKDIAEIDNRHLIETEKMYHWLLTHKKNWVKIDCVENGNLKSVKEINSNIQSLVIKNGI